MTLTGNCPPDCPAVQERRLACLVHDADVHEVRLAALARRHLADLKAKQAQAGNQQVHNEKAMNDSTLGTPR